MKKITTIFALFVFTLTLLAGCGNARTASSEASSAAVSGSSSQIETQEEILTGIASFTEHGHEDYVSIEGNEAWTYSSEYAEEYPDIATYISGDNFISFSGYTTGETTEEALESFKQANIALFGENAEVDEKIVGDWTVYSFPAVLDGSDVDVYVNIREEEGCSRIPRAQAYIAECENMEAGHLSVQRFIETLQFPDTED